jgi:hypothetical protein
MTESKINAQQKRQEYLDQYEEKYVTWTKRVDKAEKTPKKMQVLGLYRRLSYILVLEIKRIASFLRKYFQKSKKSEKKKSVMNDMNVILQKVRLNLKKRYTFYAQFV